MRLVGTYEIAGERITVTSKPVDIVKWEKANRRKISDGLGFTEIARIIFGAGKRQGIISADAIFESWIDTLDDFEVEKPEDPTSPQQEASEG